jgi:hypothetical protein
MTRHESEIQHVFVESRTTRLDPELARARSPCGETCSVMSDSTSPPSVLGAEQSRSGKSRRGRPPPLDLGIEKEFEAFEIDRPRQDILTIDYGMTLFVGGLTKDMTDDTLRQHCLNLGCGGLISTKVTHHEVSNNRRNMSFGFVHFSTMANAMAAMMALKRHPPVGYSTGLNWQIAKRSTDSNKRSNGAFDKSRNQNSRLNQSHPPPRRPLRRRQEEAAYNYYPEAPMVQNFVMPPPYTYPMSQVGPPASSSVMPLSPITPPPLTPPPPIPPSPMSPAPPGSPQFTMGGPSWQSFADTSQVGPSSPTAAYTSFPATSHPFLFFSTSPHIPWTPEQNNSPILLSQHSPPQGLPFGMQPGDLTPPGHLAPQALAASAIA